MSTKRRVRKQRKPKEFSTHECYADIYLCTEGHQIHIDHNYFDNAKDCRRLAKWLERAASWIEAREGKR